MKRSPRRRLLYQLAVMAGEWNVGRIEHGLTAKRFLAWEAYAGMEPFGELRDDYRAASIASMVFNMAVAAKDRKPISEFLLQWDEELRTSQQKQTWQQKKQIAYAVAMAYSVRAKDLT